MRALELDGKKFGRLTAVRRVGHNRYGHIQWACRCVCGKRTVVGSVALSRGVTQSCGCLAREVRARTARARSLKHGHSAGGKITPEYMAWASMLYRCSKMNGGGHPHYAGRGIRVCRRWRKFENFFADMGRRPSKKHSLDRENNSKSYCLNNCRWATPRQQANNRRTTVKITFRGKTLSITEWARELGLNTSTLAMRIRSGWPVKAALSARVFAGKKRLSYRDALAQAQAYTHNKKRKPLVIGRVSMSMSDWARRAGISPETLWNRLHRLGWSPSKAVKPGDFRSKQRKMNRLEARTWN